MEFTIFIEKLLCFMKDNFLGIIGLFLAHLGLKTWKKQLKGNEEYNIAKKILHQIYKLRFGVQKIRSPMIWAYESHIDANDIVDGVSLKTQELNKAYSKRYEFLNEVKNELYVDLLEAEILWGDKIYDLVYDILDDIKQLEIAVEDYVRYYNLTKYEQEDSYWKERMIDVKKIIFAKSLNYSMKDSGDEYFSKLANKIINIEIFLKKYLSL